VKHLVGGKRRFSHQQHHVCLLQCAGCCPDLCMLPTNPNPLLVQTGYTCCALPPCPASAPAPPIFLRIMCTLLLTDPVTLDGFRPTTVTSLFCDTRFRNIHGSVTVLPVTDRSPVKTRSISVLRHVELSDFPLSCHRTESPPSESHTSHSDLRSLQVPLVVTVLCLSSFTCPAVFA
jgi:hypothetical protein